jgi:hypothetical protein
MQDNLELPEEDAAALLQLAMNSKWPATGTTALQRMPQHLEADNARKLLITAAARLHEPALQHMLGLEAFKQHVDASTIEAVLMHSVTAAGVHNGMFRTAVNAFDTKVLSHDATVKLLHAAAKSDQVTCMMTFCRLPQVQQLSSKELVEVLQTAVKRGNEGCIIALTQLPVAQQISSEAVVQLLQAAVLQGVFVYHQRGSDRLCGLPGAQNIGCDAVARLLLMAAEHTSFKALEQMLGLLPTAQLLSNAQVSQLLEAVMHPPPADPESISFIFGFEIDGTSCVTALCKLLAAQKLSNAVVAHFLRTAVE